jgi:C4-dicarboxylate-specific signal transduction histidine kinase
MKRWSIVSSVLSPQAGEAGPNGSWRPWAILGCALTCWILASWFLVGRYEAGLTESYLRRERVNAQRDIHSINTGVSRSWEIAQGFLTTLAHQEGLRAALDRRDAGSAKQAIKHSIVDDPQFAAISRSFFSMVGDIKVLNIITLLDAEGDCIAASNGIAANSLVGNNYADRRYFQDAKRGLNGAEFANGRATSLPGLFLSVPVIRDGVFIGAIMAKFDASSFAPWLNFSDSIITDEHGVILFARDSSYLYKELPGGDVERLGQAEKVALYKRTSFNPVPASRFSDALPADIVKIEDRPVPLLLVSEGLSAGVGQVGVMHPLPRLLLLERDRWRLFALVAICGAVVQLVFFGLMQRLQESLQRRRMAENEVAFHQSVIDAAALAIAVYAEDGHCLAANDAMAHLFGTTRPMMARQNFRLSDAWAESGLVNAAALVLDAGAAQRGHWRLVPNLGREIWIDGTLKRFTYQARNFLLVIFSDVSDQHWNDGLMSEG